MPSFLSHLTAAFGGLTTFITIKFWLIISPIIIRYETALVILLIVFMYAYVQCLIKYHQPLMKAQNLLQYDMMRSLHFETPQFIQMGFKDLDIGRDKCWHLKHKCFAYCANQGRREYMEDRMHYMHDPANNNLSIFSIFDGHGGKFVSEYLEEHFSKNIRNRILFGIPSRRLSTTTSHSNEPFQAVKEAIVKEVHKMDDEIGRFGPRKTSFTGSTLISAILEHNRFLTVVNVGDSRAVGCDHRGKAVVLSKDHKPSDASERHRIESAGGFIQNYGVDRVQGVLAVSRAFGDTHLKREDVITAHPDIVRVDLTQRPLRYLIVASDGLFDVFENQEAVDFANQYLKIIGTSKWTKLAEAFCSEALARGSEDNVSVLVIKLLL